MKVNSGATTKINMNRSDIKEEDSFTYLGRLLDPTREIDTDITARINKAQG